MHVKKYTGKSLSEALIFESVNPQYDERLFIEFQEKCKFTTCCVQTLGFFWFFFDIQNNICTQHHVNMLWTCIFLGIRWTITHHFLANWCKTEGFWKRFTCSKKRYRRDQNFETILFINGFWPWIAFKL